MLHDPIGSSDDRGGVEPYEAIALRVLRQAFEDARNPLLPALERQNAREFLYGHTAGLRQWCESIGVDPNLVTQRARRLLDALPSDQPRSSLARILQG